MADIRNDQFLHRPGAGRGAITPADPLEARLYDGAGQPIAPATEGKQDSIIAALNTLATTLGTEATLGLLKAALDTISGKVATETTLGQAVQKLTDLLARLENALTVQGSVGVTGDVDVSDNAERELGKVTLTGQTVEIGAKQFFVVKGERIVGKAADRPSASDAAAAMFDGVFYHAHDTGDVWQASDGDWRHLGVA